MNHEGKGVHWVEYDIGEGTLAIGVAEGMSPSKDGCSVSLEVDDFENAISELKAANVEFNFGPIETPVCHMAFVQDPDGNSVGICQTQARAPVNQCRTKRSTPSTEPPRC